MTKRGAFFANVNRLMHGPAHARWFNAKRLSPDGGGGGGSKKYDAEGTGAVEIVDPKTDISGWIASLREQGQEAMRTAKTAEEKHAVVLKLASDLEEVQLAQKKMAEDLASKLREVPNGREVAKGQVSLRGVSLRYNPNFEFDTMDRKVGFDVSFKAWSPLQANILLRSNENLGIEDRDTQRMADRLRYLHDTIVLKVKYAERKNPSSLMPNGWQMLPEAAEYTALSNKFREADHELKLTAAAMNETNSTEGAAWVPGAMLSSRIFPFIEMDWPVQRAFEVIQMPGPIYDNPVVKAKLKSTILTENTDRDAAHSGTNYIIPTYFQTRSFRLQAYMHETAVVATPPWLQDNVSGSDQILREIADSFARGRGDWFMNGQAGGSRPGTTGAGALDSALTITLPDIRLIGNGLRYWYSQMLAATATTGVSNIDASTGLTSDLLAKAIGQGRAYAYPANRNIWITSTVGAAQMLVLKTQAGYNVVLTDNEMGSQATFRTGSLGKAFGRDILPDASVSEQMDANGLQDNASDRTIILHVNTDAIKRGERAGVAVDYSDQVRFFEYQEAWRAVAREDFASVYDPTTEPFIQAITGLKKNW